MQPAASSMSCIDSLQVTAGTRAGAERHLWEPQRVSCQLLHSALADSGACKHAWAELLYCILHMQLQAAN